MTIEHVALWTTDLERLRTFYIENFGCAHDQKYANPRTGFSSYFLRFDAGARLEIMTRPDVSTAPAASPQIGYAHFAFSVGSEEQVRAWTEKFRTKGIPIVSEPRWTGDGYYESVVTDPDGNLIELTI